MQSRGLLDFRHLHVVSSRAPTAMSTPPAIRGLMMGAGKGEMNLAAVRLRLQRGIMINRVVSFLMESPVAAAKKPGRRP